MIFFDTTKARGTRHKSGLHRVSTRLLEELGARAVPVWWGEGRWCSRDGVVAMRRTDWLLTPELFSEEERPGFGAFLEGRTSRTAAIFHDAIPLRMPAITWPQSVARHPAYMKSLARFERVLPVSEASARELEGYWRWLGVKGGVVTPALRLGADATSRIQSVDTNVGTPVVLQVGILEPRKNQIFTLEVCEALWSEGLRFRLVLAGRVNPHFGAPVLNRVRKLQAKGRDLVYEERLDDEALGRVYRSSTLLVFPSLAEGCGLPVLEALAAGLPCLCNDLPVLRENADGGGCVCVSVDSKEGWIEALRRVMGEVDYRESLRAGARLRCPPTWAKAAAQVAELLDD